MDSQQRAKRPGRHMVEASLSQLRIIICALEARMILLLLLLLQSLNLRRVSLDEGDYYSCIAYQPRPVPRYLPEACPACDADPVILVRVIRTGDGEVLICTRYGWEIPDNAQYLQIQSPGANFRSRGNPVAPYREWISDRS
jgi:hypothetical protein